MALATYQTDNLKSIGNNLTKNGNSIMSSAFAARQQYIDSKKKLEESERNKVVGNLLNAYEEESRRRSKEAENNPSLIVGYNDGIQSWIDESFTYQNAISKGICPSSMTEDEFNKSLNIFNDNYGNKIKYINEMTQTTMTRNLEKTEIYDSLSSEISRIDDDKLLNSSAGELKEIALKHIVDASYRSSFDDNKAYFTPENKELTKDIGRNICEVVIDAATREYASDPMKYSSKYISENMTLKYEEILKSAGFNERESRTEAYKYVQSTLSKISHQRDMLKEEASNNAAALNDDIEQRKKELGLSFDDPLPIDEFENLYNSRFDKDDDYYSSSAGQSVIKAYTGFYIPKQMVAIEKEAEGTFNNIINDINNNPEKSAYLKEQREYYAEEGYKIESEIAGFEGDVFDKSALVDYNTDLTYETRNKEFIENILDEYGVNDPVQRAFVGALFEKDFNDYKNACELSIEDQNRIKSDVKNLKTKNEIDSYINGLNTKVSKELALDVWKSSFVERKSDDVKAITNSVNYLTNGALQTEIDSWIKTKKGTDALYSMIIPYEGGDGLSSDNIDAIARKVIEMAAVDYSRKAFSSGVYNAYAMNANVIKATHTLSNLDSQTESNIRMQVIAGKGFDSNTYKSSNPKKYESDKEKHELLINNGILTKEEIEIATDRKKSKKNPSIKMKYNNAMIDATRIISEVNLHASIVNNIGVNSVAVKEVLGHPSSWVDTNVYEYDGSYRGKCVVTPSGHVFVPNNSYSNDDSEYAVYKIDDRNELFEILAGKRAVDLRDMNSEPYMASKDKVASITIQNQLDGFDNYEKNQIKPVGTKREQEEALREASYKSELNYIISKQETLTPITNFGNDEDFISFLKK